MVKKKIGILTLPFRHNYGGIFQAYALMTFLKKSNYDVHLIDRQWDILSKRGVVYYIKRLLYYFLIRKIKSFYIKKIVPKTVQINSQKEMQILNNLNFDAIIVGSDQVWRREFTIGVKNNFFLDFLTNKKIKKIAYGASFGIDVFDENDKIIKDISILLKKFDNISVRESSGVLICKKLFNVHADHVLDPVFLLDNLDYLKLVKKNSNKKKILCSYILDNSETKSSIVKTISKKFKLKVKESSSKKNTSLILENRGYFDFYNYICPSLEDWLSDLYYADFIVTDSYHGLVCSIIFNKQFIVIANRKRGLTRFESLLEKLNIKNRLIFDEFDVISLSERIDYNQINDKLEKLKKISKKFILNSLINQNK